MSFGLNIGGPLRAGSPQKRIELEDEIAAEIAFHLEMRAEENRAHGMSVEAAETAARSQFGDVDRIARECIYAAERHPLRVVGRKLRTTVTTGLGLGLATSILLVAWAVLIRPPATYQSAGSWVGIWWQNEATGDRSPESSINEFFSWKEQAESFDEMALATYRLVVLDAGTGAHRAMAKFVSPGYFDQHGVVPHIGRNFYDDRPAIDGRTGTVLSFDLWKQEFDGDTGIVGRVLRVDGREYVVTGVAPEGFRMFNETALWLPYDFETVEWRNLPMHLASGKLKAGVTVSDARRDLARITPATSGRGVDSHFRSVLPRKSQSIYGADVVDQTWLFASLAALIIAFLLLRLSRDSSSPSELIPAVLLASVVAAATIGMSADATLGTAGHRFNFDFALSIFLLIPAAMALVGWVLFLVRRLPSPVLWALQVAGAFAIIVASMMATVSAMQADDDPAKVHSHRWRAPHIQPAIDILLPEQPFRDRSQIGSYFNKVAGVVDANRAFQATGVARRLSGDALSLDLEVGTIDRETRDTVRATGTVSVVDSNFFAWTGLPLEKGRLFGSGDTLAGPRVSVVTDSLARLLWPSEDPLGNAIFIGQRRVELEVVGIVSGPEPSVYASFSQLPGRSAVMWLDAGTRQLRDDVLDDAIGLIRSVDTGVAVTDLTRGAGHQQETGSPLKMAIAFWILALTMLTLVWQTVSADVRAFVFQRAREIGVRKLLGASTRSVMGLLLRPISKPSLLGLTLGLPLAYGMGVWTMNILDNIPAIEPWVFLAAGFVVASVIALAGTLPALRVTKIRPVATLRPLNLIQTQGQ